MTTRVLFTIPNLEGGGAERVMATLLTHIDRDRITPLLALVSRTGVHLERIPEDVPIHDLGGRGPLAFLRLLLLIRRLKPDVVFATLSFYSTLVLLLKPFAPKGTRFIVRENNQPAIHLPSMPYGGLRMWLYPIAHKRADAIVCQSPEMIESVLAMVPVARSRLIHIANPLDIDAITAGSARPNPYDGGGRHLVAAGRLKPVKGFDMLLEAFSHIRREREDVTLHILGEGPEQTALQEQAKRLGVASKVRFEGFQTDPLAWFEHADLFVLSSRYEGFPNVTLEALACGTPVVSFDCPGGSPVVDGQNGWMVPEGDVDALAARILATLDGPPLDPEVLIASVEQHRIATVVTAFEILLTGESL